LKLNAVSLLNGIDGVLYAVSADKTRPAFSGVLLALENNQMTVAATNGVCVAEYTEEILYDGPPIKAIIPGMFAAKANRSFFNEDMLKINLTPSMIFISSNTLLLGGSLINATFPEYRSFIPKPDTLITTDKYVLLDNLGNMAYQVSKVEDNRVSLMFSEKQLAIGCGESVNTGISTDFAGNLQTDVNLSYLLSSLTGIKGDQLRMGFTKSGKLVQFLSVNDSPGLRTYLVALNKV